MKKTLMIRAGMRLFAIGALSLQPVFAAAGNGNCLKGAVSLSVKATETTTAVTLVRAWDQHNGKWSGETEEKSSFEKWYKVSLTRGKPYVFWTTDTSNENICLSVDPDYDSEKCPYTGFSNHEIGQDQYCYVTADDWDEEDPSTCTFYVSLTGGDYESGKTITLHYRQADISDVWPKGTEDNPEVLDVSKAGTVTRKTPGKTGEYYFRVSLKAGITYTFSWDHDPMPTFDIDCLPLEAGQTCDRERLMCDDDPLRIHTVVVTPHEDGPYSLHLVGEDTQIGLATAFVWTDPATGIEWSFTLDGDKATVTGVSSAEGAVVIPSELGGCPVIGIDEWVFSCCGDLTDVTIPASVTNIGNYAFETCSALGRVTIPAGVRNLGESVFSDCAALTNVTLQAGLSSIGVGAFMGCCALTDVTIPASVTDIGEFAFDGCTGLGDGLVVLDGCVVRLANEYACPESVELPVGTRLIADGAFACCKTLTRIVIPEGVTSIGACAFQSCDTLTDVTIPASVVRIGYNAFLDCTGLGTGVVIVDDCVLTVDDDCPETVVLPAGTRVIAGGAFETGYSIVMGPSGAYGLESITIPGSVVYIGDLAFWGCRDLKVDFEGAPPAGVVKAEFPMASAFRYNIEYEAKWLPVVAACGWENAVPYEPGKLSDGGPYTEKVGAIEWTFMVSGGEASVGTGSPDGTAVAASVEGDIVVPSELGGRPVTGVGDCAFSGCAGLRSVTVSSGVMRLGRLVFDGCEGLGEVSFEGDAPGTDSDVFLNTPVDMVVRIRKEGSTGWLQWNGRKVAYDGAAPLVVTVNMVVTNVVVHYIQTSELSPMAAPITPDTGIVNVMTEIGGGNIAIPESWASNYPLFEAKFGSNFTDALTRETGKYDANHRPLRVWQDYVAGTDPTNPGDTFKASVTMVGGKPVISYTPELSEEEAAKRVYTTYGKVKLQDEQWVEIPAGHEDDYNFFKVSVRMR